VPPVKPPDADTNEGMIAAYKAYLRYFRVRRSRTLSDATAEDVLQFWFPEESTLRQSADLLRQVEWWFRGGADAEIVYKFPALLEEAERGELDAWAGSARSRLALIIVLDQFSRSIHRGSTRTYANDPKALALAREGIEIGQAAALQSPWEQIFFGLPLGHSEDLASQELGVKLMEQLVLEAWLELRAMLEFSAEQARGHRDVIARFGHHPHRNEALGRTSTPEELDYLARNQLIHMRPCHTSTPH
jgi:uncharacterized protein (DUF924 family)